jgi:predicted ATPase
VRIAVSGTHCCGKSTLVADFLAAHRDYIHEPEPYEWLQETEPFADQPSADDFYRQLEFSVERLRGYERGARVIVERSPVDFVAYLLALGAADLADRALAIAAEGIRHLDLIVFLPLNDRDGIIAPDAEDLELREAANECLVEIFAGEEIELPPVIDVRGTPAERLAALERAALIIM